MRPRRHWADRGAGGDRGRQTAHRQPAQRSCECSSREAATGAAHDERIAELQSAADRHRARAGVHWNSAGKSSEPWSRRFDDVRSKLETDATSRAGKPSASADKEPLLEPQARTELLTQLADLNRELETLQGESRWCECA